MKKSHLKCFDSDDQETVRKRMTRTEATEVSHGEKSHMMVE